MSQGISLSHNLASPSNWFDAALPAYIKSLPSRFGQDDIAYLQGKGALVIPDQPLRNALLQSYADYVHPLMPLLDLHQLTRIVNRNDGVEPISLLLFQAVMFAGVATVDMGPLTAAGHSSRREARRAFFNKTRLLYDLDYEDDSIALIQSLLLMTYWREDPSGRKETHHWLAIAVSQAQKIGLHRNPDDTVALEPWQKKLRKRIWWSAYIRDCQIALGTRRSTIIKEVDSDVPVLQLQDFNVEPLPQAPYHIPPDCQIVQDPEKQRQLAILAIEMAGLSMRISHGLSVRYGVTKSKGSTRTAIMLHIEPPGPDCDEIQTCVNTLRDWKDRLPEAARYAMPSRHDVDLTGSCLVLNRAYLHMTFYAALAAFHRSLLVPAPSMIPCMASSIDVEESHRTVRFAATRITEIAGTLHNLDLVRYLPSPAITVLLPAIVVHLLDVLAVNKSLPIKSMQDFCKCMQIMAGLREMYAAADYSTAFLHNAIQRTEIGPVTPPTEEDRNRGNVIPSADLAAEQELNHPQQIIPVSQFSPQNLIFDATNTGHVASPMNANSSNSATMTDQMRDFELGVNDVRNVDVVSPSFNTGNGGGFGPAMQNGSSVFPPETDWLMGIDNDGMMLVDEQGEPSMLWSNGVQM